MTMLNTREEVADWLDKYDYDIGQISSYYKGKLLKESLLLLENSTGIVV